jgi:hypothetical protein
MLPSMSVMTMMVVGQGNGLAQVLVLVRSTRALAAHEPGIADDLREFLCVLHDLMFFPFAKRARHEGTLA